MKASFSSFMNEKQLNLRNIDIITEFIFYTEKKKEPNFIDDFIRFSQSKFKNFFFVGHINQGSEIINSIY